MDSEGLSREMRGMPGEKAELSGEKAYSLKLVEYRWRHGRRLKIHCRQVRRGKDDGVSGQQRDGSGGSEQRRGGSGGSSGSGQQRGKRLKRAAERWKQ